VLGAELGDRIGGADLWGRTVAAPQKPHFSVTEIPVNPLLWGINFPVIFQDFANLAGKSQK
jgi:hypothetical protein